MEAFCQNGSRMRLDLIREIGVWERSRELSIRRTEKEVYEVDEQNINIKTGDCER
jgi:hypothetical protein